MTLVEFLQDLFSTGQLNVAGRLTPFADDDLQQAAAILLRIYTEDRLHLPNAAPAFSAEAALWSAQLLYHSVQLTLLRDLDETVVHTYLTDFRGPVSPAIIYSADLTLRYLPDLLQLAKGLAPADILVVRLQQLGQQWPFSFVGVELEGPLALASLLAHPALRAGYTDRVIRTGDLSRARQPEVTILVQEALGHYAAELWPEFSQATAPSI
ncbi:hypothetical protein [Hymenobacter wooponensis]|uniref:MoxR-vWA-beta-propeller ternary system domain-containing protein n=1 Tax=Hymenobacter wooponensis TaxID=1525360 RepID=A0A4Z0MIH2_9BACT|nr:hypothetical protein [Hymenobacter wooponensis]TGD79543.1 hypothetical protein EU557_15070 [Hymenobacter wooponensis]